MSDTEPSGPGACVDVDSHLRRVLQPGPGVASDLVARALVARGPRRRLVAVPIAAAVVVVLAYLSGSARRAEQAPPRLTAVTVGRVVVATTPAGAHWIVDRHGATRRSTGPYLVVRGQGGR